MFFAVAFIPLWLILSINGCIAGIWNYEITIICITLIIALTIFVKHYIKKLSGTKKGNYFKVEKRDDITLGMAFYILAYTPVLFIDKFALSEMVTFGILLSTIYLVYVKANLIHVNPILVMMGYKTYRVTDEHSNTVVLLSRLNVRIHTEVKYVEITPNINLVLD